ncbi:hypothetical protein [Ralstonia pseudosolanacearum]|uniref:hypothetical protein n=1 Tax=Ralstonia pseudosolanacearum TaxID=1310165 RepID=UPI001FF88003|nr:hypothetical protein [Ralstonia pseudosolanacearum]
MKTVRLEINWRIAFATKAIERPHPTSPAFDLHGDEINSIFLESNRNQFHKIQMQYF